MRVFVVALAALLLAGCFGGGKTPEKIKATNTTAPTTRALGPNNATLAALNETNRTEAGSGGLAHRHDLWAGHDRVNLVKGSFGMTSCCLATKPGADGPITLPPGARIFEGTGSVEATFTNPVRRVCMPFSVDVFQPCTDAAAPVPDPQIGPPGIHLLLQHGTSGDWVDAGEISWGKPVVFPISDVRMVDMPHALTTLWKFEVRGSDPALETLRFDVSIDALRSSGEIPLWPGHPDFYAESHVRTVVHANAKSAEGGASSVPTQSTAAPTARPDKLISYGTKGLHIFVNVTSFASPDPAESPSSWYLAFENASGRWNDTYGWKDQSQHGADKKSQEWVFAIDDNGMDSPYAAGSRWDFRLQAVSSIGTPDGTTRVLDCTGGCAAYTAEYAITVLALDADAWKATAPGP